MARLVDAKKHGTGVVRDAKETLKAERQNPVVLLDDIDATRENIEAINATERQLAALASKLTDKERRFVEAWGLGHLDPKQAMRVAGYAESTIMQRGPTYLFHKHDVMAYAAALCEGRVDAVVDVIKAQLLRLEMALPVALNTLIVMAGTAENENVRVRAATTIVELAKGILIASLPKKSVDYTEMMTAIYQSAKEEREKMKKPTPGTEEVEWQPWVETVAQIRKQQEEKAAEAPEE